MEAANKGEARTPSSSGAAMASVSDPRASAVIKCMKVLAFIIVFTVCGMVPLEEILFTVFTVAYTIIIAQVAFPNRNKLPLWYVVQWGDRLPLLAKYIKGAGVVGVVLPVVYICGGYVAGDKAPAVAAVPHLFLLGAQICMEMFATAAKFSPPAHALVPISFNARRLITLMRWCHVEFTRTCSPGLGLFAAVWLWYGRTLAVMNMALWSFNLLCFLIPVYLPKTFALYLSPEYSSPPVAAASTERGASSGAQDDIIHGHKSDDSVEEAGSFKKLK